MTVHVYAVRWCECPVEQTTGACGDVAISICEECGMPVCESHELICTNCEAMTCRDCVHACAVPDQMEFMQAA
jgi:predicted sulfurtransferase